jgi:hypothetical protein
MNDKCDPHSNNQCDWQNAIAGATLGALIALLIALSNTAVVSTTLTVFLGAAVVFLSLQDKISPGRADSMTSALLYRIMGFAVAAIAALLLGLFLRASNAFGDSDTIRLYRDLIEIGVTEEVARKTILEHLKVETSPAETETERLVHSTTLFSSGASETSCSDMDPTNFNNVESVIARYTAEGGAWKRIANTVQKAMNTKSKIDGPSFVAGLYTSYCAEHLK